MKKLDTLIRSARRDLAVFSACISLLMLTIPIYLLQVYDRVLSSSSMNTLIFITIAAGLAIAVMSLLETVRFLYSAKVAGRIDDTLSRQVLKAMLLKSDGSGDVGRLRDLSTVRAFIEQRTALVVFDLPFALLFTIILFFIHPYIGALTLVGVILLGVFAAIQYWLTKEPTMEAAGAASQDLLAASVLTREAPTARALGMVDALTGTWAEHHASGLVKNISASSVSARLTGISKLVRLSLQIAILGLGAYLVLTNQMTAGMIFAASIVSGRALQPIDQLVGSWRQIFDARGAWDRVKAVALVAEADEEKVEREAPSGRITIEELAFVVPGADQQLKVVLNVKGLQFQPGEAVAIIGPSGSGKSTLLRILAGAQGGYRGKVRIDETALTNWDPAFLGAHMGYLPQEADLLPGTVAQNIARFAEDATDDEVITAAKLARIDAMVEALPAGYNTQISAHSLALSGGQKQLICLARAFFRSPPILIMDEPSANLDVYGKEAYKKVLDDVRATGKTLIFATHDSDLIKLADKVCVIENGMVKAFETPANIAERQSAERDKRANKIKAAAANRNPAPEAEADKSPFAEFGPGLRPRTASEKRGLENG
ncbi:MAG: type I secretion system permease/ATPase [Pseudomonadota bacterium]